VKNISVARPKFEPVRTCRARTVLFGRYQLTISDHESEIVQLRTLKRKEKKEKGRK
jgi:hypothetical protein